MLTSEIRLRLMLKKTEVTWFWSLSVCYGCCFTYNKKPLL